jgi:GntR family transcriptional regulator
MRRAEEDDHSGDPSCGRSRRPVSASPLPRASARFFDQRLLVKRFERCGGVSAIGRGWTGRRGDGHGRLQGVFRASLISIMLRVKIDRRDPTELHLQVAASIRRAIAEGEVKPGERMPPAKDLAAVLGANTNTVLRALRDLRDEGLLEFRRGRGITVSGTPERGAVLARTKELIDFARTHGYQPDEITRMIEQLT